jgi:hypothetical protein
VPYRGSWPSSDMVMQSSCPAPMRMPRSPPCSQARPRSTVVVLRACSRHVDPSRHHIWVSAKLPVGSKRAVANEAGALEVGSQHLPFQS